MSRSLRIAFACAMALALAGCAKKPIVAAAPPPPPPTATVSVPPPTHPTEPLPKEPLIASPSLNIPAETPVKPPARPRLRPTPNPTEAMVTPPAGIVDLGQLTTGGESNNEQMRRQTDDLLKTQNRRLSSLPASITAMHSKQVEQARLYLKQAGDAWNKQDIEGARTLGTKAKVILDEIQS
ncbi:MAG TPA: hypothetical protein VIM67_07715 [Terriglobus sp.]